MSKKTVTILCAVFNEQEAIPLFYERLNRVLDPLRQKYTFEILFTNNASTDNTLKILRELRAQDSSVQIITLSRDFGYQASLTSGLQHASGDATIIIDVDCEDPPEMIPTFIAGWEEGFEIVYGQRHRRHGSIFLRFMQRSFYRVTRQIADFDFVLDMAEFCLFTRRIRGAILDNHSTFPFLRAELGFVGFKRKGIPYIRDKRIAGVTHYNYWRMFKFAFAGILSSSTFFLRLGFYVGTPLVAITFTATCAWFFIDISAYLPFFLMVDLTYVVAMIAIISTYLARIYKDGVRRPVFVIDWDHSFVDSSLLGRKKDDVLASVKDVSIKEAKK